MVEAPNPLGVHPTSKSYVNKVFQHLDMLWMGIWVHRYTVTPVHGVNILCFASSMYLELHTASKA